MLRFRIKNLVALAIILICLFSFLSIPNITYATSADTSYSSVLEDLQKDESFHIDDYPVIENDYSLDVIQIAESSNDELFVYVYQPKADNDILATSINISTGIDENLSYVNYKLQKIDSYQTLFKYKVIGFEVLDIETRYYDISSIFRLWIDGVDLEVGNDNTVSEVAFEVSKLYTVVTFENNVYYYCSDTEVVEIVGKYVGFIRYTTVINWTGKACDSHFVAFSTDYDIDSLYEIEISYITRTYKKTTDNQILGGGTSLGGTTTYEYGENETHNETYYSDDQVEVEVGLIFKTQYTWDRILSVNDFKSSLEDSGIVLSSSAESGLSDKQWVLSFYESDYKKWADSIGTVALYDYETGVNVMDVTILRLKFETDGVVYNLGVVDNKQTGSEDPSGHTQTFWEKVVEWFNNLVWWLKFILYIILGLLCVPILILLCKFFKWLYNCLFGKD